LGEKIFGIIKFRFSELELVDNSFIFSLDVATDARAF